MYHLKNRGNILLSNDMDIPKHDCFLHIANRFLNWNLTLAPAVF